MNKEDLYDYIRCYIMSAYHNIEHGDADVDFVHEQLFKAIQLIRDLKRTELIEVFNG